MVELKETTAVNGFGDAGWSDDACFRTGTGTGTGRAGIPLGIRRVPDEAGGPGSSNVMELEGSGGGKGVGGITTTKGNGNGNVQPPVELPSCGNGFAELPTEFNRRCPGEDVG